MKKILFAFSIALVAINAVLFSVLEANAQPTQPAQLSINSPAPVDEGGGADDSGSTPIEFTISLTATTGQPFSVPVTFAHGTGPQWTNTDDADFMGGTAPLIAPVEFSGDDMSQTVTVRVNWDGETELDETFTLTLGTPTGTATDMNLVELSPTSGDQKGTGTIRNDDQSTLSIWSNQAVVSEGTGSGSTAFDFWIVLSNPVSASLQGDELTVPVAFNHVNTNNEDFTDNTDLTIAPVSFPPTATGKSIRVKATIRIEQDNTAEPDETFTLTLGTPTGSAITNNQVHVTPSTGVLTVTIEDDDGKAKLSIDSPERVYEGNGSGSTNIEFTITLTSAPGQPFSVPVTFAHETTDNADFMGNTAPVIAPVSFSGTDSDTSQTVRVKVNRDDDNEPNETFTLTLGTPTGTAANMVELSLVKVGTGTIRNDDYALAVINTPVHEVYEGTADSGSTDIEFTVSLRPAVPLGQPFSVPVFVRETDVVHGGTDESDYFGGTKPPIRWLKFSGAETAKTVTVRVNPDYDAEPDEIFVVDIGYASTDVSGTAADMGLVRSEFFVQKTVMILDDDGAQLTIDNLAPVFEGTGNDPDVTTDLVFTIKLTPAVPLGQPFSVPVSFYYNPDSLTGSDFFGDVVPFFGMVDFSASDLFQQIRIRFKQDDVKERDESFRLRLGTPTGKAAEMGLVHVKESVLHEGNGTILDDDGAKLSIDSPGPVIEGTGEGSTDIDFTISLTSAPGQPFSVPVALSYGNPVTSGKYYERRAATNDHDFIDTSRGRYGLIETLMFSGSETDLTKTVTIKVNKDDIHEPDEYFNVNLHTPTGPAVDMGLVHISPTRVGTVKILDDDGGKLSINSPAPVSEGTGAGTTDIEFTISLTPAVALGQPFEVPVRFSHGTGAGRTDDSDFFGGTRPANRTVEFLGTETFKKVKIKVKKDNLNEQDETFRLILGAPTGTAADMNLVQLSHPYQIFELETQYSDTAGGIGTILNDDGTRIQLTTQQTTAVVEGGTFQIKLKAVRPLTGGDNDINVTSLTASGFAGTFSAGVSGNPLVLSRTGDCSPDPSCDERTVTVTAVDNSNYTNGGILTVDLLRRAGYGVESSNSSISVDVSDDEPAPIINLSAPQTPVAEDGTFTLTLTPTPAIGNGHVIGIRTLSVSGVDGIVCSAYCMSRSISFVEEHEIGTSTSDFPYVMSSTSDNEITVRVINNDYYQGTDGRLTVSIGDPGNSAYRPGTSASVPIIEEETVPTISLSAPQTPAVEGGTFTLTLTPVPAIGGGHSVEIKTLSVTGVTSSLPSGTSDANKYVMNSTSANTITVSVSDNNYYQGDNGRLTVSIGDPGDSTFIPGSSASVTVNDDEPVPTINLSAPQTPVAEGGTFTLTLTPSPAIGGAHAIDIKTLSVSGLDGSLSSGTSDATKYVMNSTSANTITVSVPNNTYYQGANGRVTVSIGDPGDSTYMPGASASVSVTEDEPVPTINLSAPQSPVAEGSTFTLTLTPTPLIGGSHTIDIKTLAVSGLDSSLSTGTSDADKYVMTSNSANTITVSVPDNTYYQGANGRVTVSIGDPGDSTYIPGAPVNVPVTETDSIPTISMSLSATNLNEGSSVTLTLTASPAFGGGHSVDITTLARTGFAGIFTLSDGTTYDANSNPVPMDGETETLSVTAAEDAVVDGGGTISITFGAKSGIYMVESQNSLDITVSDNDLTQKVRLTLADSTLTSVAEGGTFEIKLEAFPALTGSGKASITEQALITSGFAGTFPENTFPLELSSRTDCNDPVPSCNERTITVTATDNVNYSNGGTLTVNLLGGTNYAAENSYTSVEVAVVDNEPVPTINLSAAIPQSATAVEEGGTFTLTMTPTPTIGGSHTIDIKTLAVSGVTGSLPSGTSDADKYVMSSTSDNTITVSVPDNTYFQGVNGRVTVSIGDPGDSTYIPGGSANVPVTEDEPVPTINLSATIPQSAAAVEEGGTFTLTLTPSLAIGGGHTIDIKTLVVSGVDGTPAFGTSDADKYVMSSSSDNTITVSVPDNTYYQGVNGRVTVSIGDPGDSTYIPGASASVPVTEDEPVPTINLSATIPQSAAAVEEGGTFTLTLTPTPAIGGSHTIDIKTLSVSGVDGTPAFGTSDANNYQMTSTSENTITVSVPDNAYYQGANGRVTVSIGDPGDSTYMSGTSANVPVFENEPKSVVSLSAPSFPNVASTCPQGRMCVDEGSSFNVTLTASPKPGGGFVLPVDMLTVAASGHQGTVSPNPPMIGESGSVVVAVTATPDNLFSGVGTLTLELSDGADYTADANAKSVSVEVIEDESSPVIAFKENQLYDGKTHCSMSSTNTSLLNCTVSENEGAMAVVLSMTPSTTFQVSVTVEAKVPTAMELADLGVTGTPAVEGDFTANNGEKSFAAQATELVFPITIANNEINGGKRIFLVEFTQPTILVQPNLPQSAGFIGSANKLTAIVTIEEDGVDRVPTVSVVADRMEINEGETAMFRFRSTSTSDLNDISFSIAEEGGYVFRHSRKIVNIPAGQTALLSVDTVRDSLIGNNGKLILTVHDGEDYVAREQSQTAEVRIINIDAENATARYSVAGSVIVSLLSPDTQDAAPPRSHADPSVPEISIVALAPRVNEGTPARFQVKSSMAVGFRLTVNLRTYSTTEITGEDLTLSVAMEPGERTAPLEVATHDDEMAGSDGRLTAMVIGGDGYRIGSQGSASVVVADEPDRLDELSSAVLPEIAASIGTRTLDATGNRVSQAFSGDTQTGLTLAGGSTITEVLETGGTMMNGDGFDLKSLLGGSSFSAALYPEDGGYSMASIWGAGDQRELSGNGFGMSDSWNGDVLTGHLGFDAKVGQGMLAGLTASLTQADVEIEGNSDAGSVLGIRTTGIHPYFGLVSGNGDTRLQLTAGYGVSELGIESDWYSTSELTGDFHTFGVEGSRRIFSGEGMLFGGLSSLNLAGESWMTRQNLQVADHSFGPLQTVASHIRMAVEGTNVWEMAVGHRVNPSISVGLRRDGRDDLAVFGYEIGSGVNYEASHGFSADVSGSAVLSGLNRLHEWKMQGSMDYDAGTDGLGILASMQPAWGGTGLDEQKFLWSRGLLDVSDSSGLGSNGASLDSEVGYGFMLADESWTLVPYGGVSLAEGNSNEVRLGNRFRIGEGISFEIEGLETVGSHGKDSRDIRITGEIHW